MDNPITALKRPKPGEGEDELMQMQEEFNRNNIVPCATVVNLRNEKKGSQSKFAQQRKLNATQKGIGTSQTGADVISPRLGDLEGSNDVVNLNNIIIGNVVERKFINDKIEQVTPVLSVLNTGFPSSFQVSASNTDDKNDSLFWQKVKQDKLNSQDDSMNASYSNEVFNITESNIITGPWASEIHNLNLHRLTEMTEEEILAEQKKLISILPASMVEFLKSKKKRSKPSVSRMDVEEENSYKKDQSDISSCSMDTTEENLPKALKEIVKDVEEKGWINMDMPEPQKLQWTEDLPLSKNSTEEPYNARFDFNGTLLPFNDERLTVDKGLHHHGEEPDRPGYSLQELLQLSRSSNQQQRCTALNTLANIIEKTRNGCYDNILQPSLLTTLNEKNIMLLLRFSLDDPSTIVVTASLQALRAFFFSEPDELCLDRMFGLDNFHEPVLKPVLNDVEDTSELKDHELAQFDSVAAVLRSDIVFRIRYILSEVKPPPVAVKAALEILTRLARHSRETALNIACTPNLLNIIVENFVPISTERMTSENTTKVYGCPLVAALRLCRILIIYAGRPAADRLNNLQITHSLLLYLNSETGKEGIRLNLESIRLWKLLLNHGIAADSISGSRLVLMSQLRLLQSNLNLNEASELYCEYATALVTVAILDEPCKEHITLLLTKWSTQLSRISTPTWAKTVLVAQTLKVLGVTSQMQTDWIGNNNIFITLCSSSNLLSNLKASDRDPTSLPNMGVLAEDGQLQPVMSPLSSMVLLSTTLTHLVNESRSAEVQTIFNNSDFKTYLSKLETSEWSLERSWYSRIEFTFLISIIRAEELLRSAKTEISDSVWKISIKLISALPADRESDMKIVLNHAFSQDRLNEGYLNNELEDLDLYESKKRKIDTEESNITSQLASTLFAKFLSRKGTQSDVALPKDWLYLPLVDAYSRLKSGSWTSNDVQNITALLKLESLMPELTENLSPSLRFSRLVLLYLCDTAFIDSSLASNTFAKLLRKYHKKLDFSSEVPGLNSFTDLFTSLCENFSGHSYGEDDFASIILVFTAQRHDVHYRKLLWSEHAGIIHYCRLTADKLLIPVEEYFYPIETDASLIESYITALVRNVVKKNVSPLLYDIAVHHSAMFLRGTSSLAVVMRARLEKLEGHEMLVKNLFNYEPVVMDKSDVKNI